MPKRSGHEIQSLERKRPFHPGFEEDEKPFGTGLTAMTRVVQFCEEKGSETWNERAREGREKKGRAFVVFPL